MLVAAMCFDKPGHEDLRQKTRAEHLTWVQAGTIDLKYGGPLLAGRRRNVDRFADHRQR